MLSGCVARQLVEPNFENASLEELEVAMKCAPTQPVALRIRAIWAIGSGVDRESVAIFCNVEAKTVLRWINEFNRAGIDGLLDEPGRGRKRAIPTDEVTSEVLPLLDDPTAAGQQHWTAVKLHGYLTEELSYEVSYPSLVRYLHEHGRCMRVPRRTPEPRDPDAWESEREAFRGRLKEWLADPDVELWFSDECGVEGDPRPRKRWVEKGSSPTVPYAGSHLRRNVIGAVCPGSGELSCLVFTHCDTGVFQAFLDNLAKDAPARPGVRQLLVMDNASWHRAKVLDFHHFEPVYLPPYSPDFNPIERFWLRLKTDFFADFFTRDGSELEERIIQGLRAFFALPEAVASQCAISV